jgi:hypothetical protein
MLSFSMARGGVWQPGNQMGKRSGLFFQVESYLPV